jgi:hypothetical protein
MGFGLVIALNWTLEQLMTTLYKLVLSVTFFTALPGNAYQQCTFLCFQDHALAGWRPSHTHSSECRFKTLSYQSQSYFTTGGSPPNNLSWSQAPWESRPVFYQLTNCCHCPYMKASLTRGWVCRLKLLLVLVSAINLRPESRWTHDHILLSQTWDSPKGQVSIFTSPRNRVPRLYPQARCLRS